MIMFILISVLVLFGGLFIFKIATRNWINPYKLYMVFGKKGAGKSTYFAKLAYEYRKKGWIVYSNMSDMRIDGVRYFDVEKLGQFVPEGHSVMLLDEVGMIWDARNFKNFKPQVRDFFKYQRHYRVICYLGSQSFDIDKKLRDLTDGMYLQLNVLNVFSIGKRIYKKIVLTESTSEAESRISENLKFAPIWNWTFTYLPKYAKMIDSFNLPPLPQLPYRELTSTDPQEELEELDVS